MTSDPVLGCFPKMGRSQRDEFGRMFSTLIGARLAGARKFPESKQETMRGQSCNRPPRGRGPDLRIRWWRGVGLNERPSCYEPDELPDCPTPRREHDFANPVVSSAKRLRAFAPQPTLSPIPVRPDAARTNRDDARVRETPSPSPSLRDRQHLRQHRNGQSERWRSGQASRKGPTPTVR